MSNQLLCCPKLRNPPSISKNQLSSIWSHKSFLTKAPSFNNPIDKWIDFIKSARPSISWTAIEDSTRCFWKPLGATFTPKTRTSTLIPPHNDKDEDSWSLSILPSFHNQISIGWYGCKASCTSWWYLGGTNTFWTGQQQSHTETVQWPE